MADVVTLDLELTDKVSRPARAAAQALREVERQQDRSQAQVNKAQERFGAAWARIGMKAAKDQDRSSAMAARDSTRQSQALRRVGLMQLQAQKMNEAFDQAKKSSHGFMASFKEKLPFRSIGDYAKGAFWGDIAAEGAMKIGEGFIEGAKKAVEIVFEGVKKAFEAGSEREQLKLNYKLLLGKEGGQAALEDIDRFSGKTRYDDDEIAKMMRPLFNAGFKGTGARSAFAAAGDLNAAGLGETSDFIDQLTKIKLKGGVGAKQLVGMGVDVQAFSKSLAKALHTDTKSAMKKAKEGGEGMDPQLLLNLIYEGIEKRQGGQLGTGTEEMGKTMGARWHKLQELPNDYLKTISESPAWTTLSDRLGGILEELNPNGEKGQRIISGLMGAFDKISGSIVTALNPANVERFIGWIDRAVKAVGNMPAVLEKVANAIMKIAEVIDKAATVLGYIESINPNNYMQKQMEDNPEGDILGRSDLWKSLMGGNEPPDKRQLSSAGTTPTGGAKSVTVDQRGLQFNVTVAPGQDPKEAGTRFGSGFNDSLVRRLERAQKERGGD